MLTVCPMLSLPAATKTRLFPHHRVLTQVAYDQEDYDHSVAWLQESVERFRSPGGGRSPENEGTLEDALDHLAFSHFKVARTRTHAGEPDARKPALSQFCAFRPETSPARSACPGSCCITVTSLGMDSDAALFRRLHVHSSPRDPKKSRAILGLGQLLATLETS